MSASERKADLAASEAETTDYEYTPFCNGPSDVKSAPSDRRVAELTLLSVVDAEAATLCCQRER